jgi:hypothetical protein
MRHDLATLRRQGLSVTSIAKLTGMPPTCVAARVGVMWDGKWPDELLQEELCEDRARRYAAYAAWRDEQMLWQADASLPQWQPSGVFEVAIEAAAAEFGVSPMDALTQHRMRDIMKARHVATVALLILGYTIGHVARLAKRNLQTVRYSARVCRRTGMDGMAHRVAGEVSKSEAHRRLRLTADKRASSKWGRQLYLACAALGTSYEDAMSTKQSRESAQSRWVAFAVLHRRGVAYAEIGRRAGMDHTTVLHGVRRVLADPVLTEAADRVAAAMGQGEVQPNPA